VRESSFLSTEEAPARACIPIVPHHHGVSPNRRRGYKLATKQRGNFIVPNLVLRQGIGPKAGFFGSLTAQFRGLTNLVRQSYRIRPGKFIVRSTIAARSSDCTGSPKFFGSAQCWSSPADRAEWGLGFCKFCTVLLRWTFDGGDRTWLSFG
jgi:hypothetical protein